MNPSANCTVFCKEPLNLNIRVNCSLFVGMRGQYRDVNTNISYFSIRIFQWGERGPASGVVAKQTSPLCNYQSIKILSVGGESLLIDLSSAERQLTDSSDINSAGQLSATQLLSDHPREQSEDGSQVQVHDGIQSYYWPQDDQEEREREEQSSEFELQLRGSKAEHPWSRSYEENVQDPNPAPGCGLHPVPAPADRQHGAQCQDWDDQPRDDRPGGAAVRDLPCLLPAVPRPPHSSLPRVISEWHQRGVLWLQSAQSQHPGLATSPHLPIPADLPWGHLHHLRQLGPGLRGRGGGRHRCHRWLAAAPLVWTSLISQGCAHIS